MLREAAKSPLALRVPDVGESLGAFALLELIGEGSMARVYRAQHRASGRLVALKVLHADFCHKLDVVRRFCREALVVKRSCHPGILDITDVVHGEGHPPFLIMELLEGEDLAHAIARRDYFDPPEAVAIATQVASALHAIHEKNILHRDLKPGNIFLVGGAQEPGGYPIIKLLDFGLVKFLYSDDPFMQSRPGAFIGTPEYMAPEQITGAEQHRQVDLYALGAILFELLTGAPPFQGETVGDTVTLAATQPPVRPSTRRPPEAQPIPALLDELVWRCLQKDPARRLGDAAKLGLLLEASLEPNHGIELPPLPRPAPWWQWAAGAAAAMGLLGAMAWFLAGS